MVPEKMPFDEALKILADLIAEKHLRILPEKAAASPSRGIKPPLASNSNSDNSGRKK